MAFIEFEHVKKTYRTGEVEIEALRDATFTIGQGELCVIVGPSGAGKTTLLNILGGMDTLTDGRVMLDGTEISAYGKRDLITYRRRDIGFVFQFYNLMPNLTALENIQLAAELSEHPLDARELLEGVGLNGREGHFPAMMSGGQQQRVAIARALCKNPDLLLCDEPTGALDTKTGVDVMRLLTNFNQKYNKTIIIVTHNPAIAQVAHKVFYFRDGHIERVVAHEKPLTVDEVEW